MADMRTLFDDLIRSQIGLWNLADARLQEELGTSVGVYDTLRAIAATDPARVQDLADRLLVTVGGMSKAVDRVEAQGLCIRRANPGDRRSSIIELTPAGKELLARANTILDRALADAVGAVLSPAESAELQRSLAKLRDVAVPAPASARR
ncbi:MarR family winged helix-turn-helix transcriptional regulator [Nocardia sp. NPDC101769]|uniref:MarR family winged helix-turn-helix transcriptional regulator n=1 Tax=Nocardia sp. NPDC101769 TaxID=3364333 RepID=UPI0038109E99